MNAHSMFHLAFTKIVEVWRPLAILLQIFRDMFGEKNMTGIAAIHHPLRDVNASAGDIGLLVQISDCIYWTAVDSHPDAQLWAAFERLRDLHCAQGWRFRTSAKDECAAIARGQAK